MAASAPPKYGLDVTMASPRPLICEREGCGRPREYQGPTFPCHPGGHVCAHCCKWCFDREGDHTPQCRKNPILPTTSTTAELEADEHRGPGSSPSEGSPPITRASGEACGGASCAAVRSSSAALGAAARGSEHVDTNEVFKGVRALSAAIADTIQQTVSGEVAKQFEHLVKELVVAEVAKQLGQLRIVVSQECSAPSEVAAAPQKDADELTEAVVPPPQQALPTLGAGSATPGAGSPASPAAQPGAGQARGAGSTAPGAGTTSKPQPPASKPPGAPPATELQAKPPPPSVSDTLAARPGKAPPPCLGMQRLSNPPTKAPPPVLTADPGGWKSAPSSKPLQAGVGVLP